MIRLFASLLVRAVILATFLGIILACATAPAFAQDTEARARVFAKELKRAAKELDVQTPTLTVLSFDEASRMGAGPLAAAFVLKPKVGTRWGVMVVWAQLMSASDARLRCWARHEMTHVLLDHGHAKDRAEADTHHDVVRHFMEAKWKQDSACLIQ